MIVKLIIVKVPGKETVQMESKRGKYLLPADSLNNDGKYNILVIGHRSFS